MRPSFRREMAQQAGAVRGVSIALACRAFAISQRCYRYAPLLADENEKIEDWLIALTKARKNWGFGLCYGLDPLTFRSPNSFMRPFARMPRGFFHPVRSVAVLDYRTR